MLRPRKLLYYDYRGFKFAAYQCAPWSEVCSPTEGPRAFMPQPRMPTVRQKSWKCGSQSSKCVPESAEVLAVAPASAPKNT